VSVSNFRSEPTAAAARPKRRIIEAEANARRHFATGGYGEQEIAPHQIIALGDSKRGRNDFRSDMGHGGAMHVAHRNRRDQITIEQRRADERQMLSADDARFISFRKRRRQSSHLSGLFPLMSGKRAGKRVQDQILAMLAAPLGQIPNAEPRGEFS
jgi:hypothetical protein